MRTLVIVPTFNERENLPRLVPAILAQGQHLDLLIVDDNSPDGTGAIADEFAAANPRIRALHRAGKLGLGTAYLAGFRYALERGYEAVVEMDADFSHNPADLPRLIAAVEAGADLAIGSRWTAGGGTENWSLLRKLISRGGSCYARGLLGLSIGDLTSGFKCFRAELLATIDLGSVQSNGYAFQVEVNYLAHQAGFTIVEVPIIFVDRTLGQSKMSWRIVQEAATRVWQLRRQRSSATTPLNRPAMQVAHAGLTTVHSGNPRSH